jgi:uncharacterized protein YbjT (DUF2867 family)
MTPTILLTGATGRLGQLVAAQLNAQGLAWRAMVRKPMSAKHLGATEIVQGDFNSVSQIGDALQGIDCMILISGDAPNQHELEMNAVAAAHHAQVRHIVKLSAQSAGLSPAVSFGKKHIRVEQAIENSGLAWTFIRPVFFQQSFLLFADTVRKGNKIILPGGQGAAAFVDARDVAECLVHVATHPGHAQKIYTLTGPQALTFKQAAQAIGQARGKSVGYIAPPAFIAKIVLPKASGMPSWLAMEVIDLLQAIAKGAQSNTTGDIQALLGKAPRSFAAFAQENAPAFSP